MREIAEREDNDGYARLWTLEDANRTLFVTYITPESATRYQFDITNPEKGLCNYTKGEGTTPPRTVVELLNEEGYEVQNLPNITEDDPAIRAVQIGEAIKWLGEHGGLDPGDIRRFAYRRAQNVLPVIYGSDLVMDIVGPDRYAELLEQALESAGHQGRNITRDELLDPRTHDIEFLQKLLIQMRRSMPMDEQEELVAHAEERLGITADGEGSDADTWESETMNSARMQLNPDAIERLEEEGWLKKGELPRE